MMALFERVVVWRADGQVAQVQTGKLVTPGCLKWSTTKEVTPRWNATGRCSVLETRMGMNGTQTCELNHSMRISLTVIMEGTRRKNVEKSRTLSVIELWHKLE